MDTASLAEVPIFSELSPVELEQLAGRMREVLFLEGQSLIEEGDLSYKFFVILDGSVEVYRDGRLLAELGSGDFVGEHGILEHERRNADVVAATSVRAAVAIGWDIRDLMEEHASVRSQVLRASAERAPQPG
jgi:CRP-like cAMP-binding protein